MPPTFGFDVRLYQLAARPWLSGGDAWSIYILMPNAGAVRFAGPPPTLLPFALLSWFPFDYISPLVVLSLAAVAMWVLHRLRLPTYWLLFPPVLDAIWFGNMNIVVVALLILVGAVATASATILKVYAVVPLIVSGRYYLAAASTVVFMATLPFLPWDPFLSQFGAISATFGEQAWGGQSSILTSPLAIAGAVIALILWLSAGTQRSPDQPKLTG